MAHNPSISNSMKQPIQPQDVVALERQFRSWIKSAHRLSTEELFTDSNLLVSKVLCVMESSVSSAAPHPSLLYCLADIFNQLPPPPEAFLFIPFILDVVDAHDNNNPIPPIPPQVYPNLRLPSRKFYPLPTVADQPPPAQQPAACKSKRKAVTPTREDENISNEAGILKKARMEAYVHQQDGLGFVGSAADGEEEQEEETGLEPELGSGALSQSQIRGAVELKRALRSDNDGEPRLSTPSVAAPPGKRAVLRPPAGLTQAQLQAFPWERYCQSVNIKGTKGKMPVIYTSGCQHCLEHSQLCWTLDKMSACMLCREKKIGCSHSVKKGGTAAMGAKMKPVVPTKKPSLQGTKRSIKASQPLPPVPTLNCLPQSPELKSRQLAPLITQHVSQAPQLPSAFATAANDVSSQTTPRVVGSASATSSLSAVDEMVIQKAETETAALVVEPVLDDKLRQSRSTSPASAVSHDMRTLNAPDDFVGDPLAVAGAQCDGKGNSPLTVQALPSPVLLPPNFLDSAGKGGIAARLHLLENENRRLAMQLQEQGSQLQTLSNQSRREQFQFSQQLRSAEHVIMRLEGQVAMLSSRPERL